MFVGDFALGVLGEFRKLFKVAFHLCPELEAPAGVPFQPLGNNARQRLVSYQHLPMARFRGVLITDGCEMHPIPIQHTRPTPVACLFRVLLTMMLRYTGKQVLDQ
ncbi:hypothetical protein SQ11_12450 [Nitrosospira sp. NpAV]|nr:hypothetical protein SQ11_12450 [Nitrosospira sp. NpAV]